MPGKSIPTPNELKVLRLLWKQGPLTVRQIRDHLWTWKKLAYTTVLTIANILVKKGWLTRKRVGKADQYCFILDEKAGKLFILQEMAERLFDGSLDELCRFVETTKDQTPPPATVSSPPPKPQPRPVKKPLPSPVQPLDVDLL
jgi:BlaI family transcriptional regulator, penicillinase repressor